MKTKIMAMALLFTLITMSAAVMADQVNMEVNVNGTANLNITVDADDTEAREDIAEIQEDLYGEPHSDPEDYMLVTLNDADEGIADLVCDDPMWQYSFDSLSKMPPADFRETMKSLGYDDETHVNMIWNICQHRYIQQQEGTWSTDNYNSEGISSDEMVGYIQGAIQWLMGTTNSPKQYSDIGNALDDYFASDRDLSILANQIYNQIEILSIRIEALETTLTRVHPDEYCTVKIELMEKYNLTKVKCGEHSAWYYMIPDPSAEKGYYIMGIKAVEEPTTTTTTIPEPVCEEDWICTDWTECDGEFQIRTCVDRNKCGTEATKPIDWQECTIPENQVLTTISGMLSRLQRSSVDPNSITLVFLIGLYAASIGIVYNMFNSGMFSINFDINPSIKTAKKKLRSANMRKEFEITLPRLKVKKPLVTIPIPRIKLSMPKVRMPSYSIEMNMPSFEIPKFSMPTLTMPKVKRPLLVITLPTIRRPKLSSIGTVLFTTPSIYFSKLISFTNSKLFWPFEKAGFKKTLPKKQMKKILSLL